MSFPKAMQDGLMIFATDQLGLSAGEAANFARRCQEADSLNQQYDLTAAKMSGGQHSIPSLKARLEQAMSTVAGEVHRKQQYNLARSQSRSVLGPRFDRPGVQPLPAPGARYIQPGSNTSAPLAGNPALPTTTKSVSDVTSGANAGVNREVMNPQGEMVNVADMSDQDLEAARQMHAGLGNSREVAVIEQEIKNRGPRGYA